MRATWPAILVALGVLGIAGCQRQAARPVAAPVAPAPVATPVGPAAAAAAPVAASEATLAVDTALTGAQAFNAKAAETLTAIDDTARKVHLLALKAVDQAGRAESAASDAQRQAAVSAYQAAQSEAQAAKGGLDAAMLTFQTDGEAQAATVVEALTRCTSDPTLAAYANCGALLVEQGALTKTIEDVGKRYTALQAGDPKDKARLAEAQVKMSLGAGLR